MKDIGEVYEDRNVLAITLALTTNMPAGYYYPEDGESEWPVVWIDTPEGQASWHVPEAMRVEDVLEEGEPPGGYDGHDRDEKNDRLLAWAAMESGV